jgi:hypothetical protein
MKGDAVSGASQTHAAKQDRAHRTTGRFDLRAYPEVRRERWERDERELLADRIAELVILKLLQAAESA